MPKSLSHVVVLTDDLDGVLGFLTDIATVDGGHDLASLSVALRALRTLVAQSRG